MKVYEMTIADIASEIFDKGEDFAEKIFNDIDELEKNKLLEINQLKQQLAEKDTHIEELEGQFAYECECNKQLVDLQKQLAEKDKEIERLKKNHLISYTNQKKAYENLKNSMNTKSLIKYPKRLDGCLIKNEQQLLDYAKESTLDIKYLRNNQTQLAIQELEKVKEKIDCEMAIREYDISEQTVDVCVLIAEQIDQQIKELKGEKDVKD